MSAFVKDENSTEWLEQPIGCMTGLAWSLITTTISALWNGGVVLRLMWSWFLIPSLHVEPLSFAAASGMYLMFRIVVAQKPQIAWSERPKKQVKDVLVDLLWTFLPSTLFLGVAWLFHHGA